MSPPAKQPKALLFDIGGVCVVSPFQAILDYELSLGIPPGWVNHSISATSPNGFWHRLETGSIPMDKDFFDGFCRDLHDETRWKKFYVREAAKHPELLRTKSGETPAVPNVDAEFLFNEMMRRSTTPDPWMEPALKKLKESGRYILAACSNTVIFPDGHPLAQPPGKDFLDHPLRGLFDVFVSSAHVGLRKPDPEMYRLTLKTVDEYARSNAGTERGKALGWAEGVKPEDVVFLDDIGENLKAAKKEGLQTIKVRLAKTFEAVDELERITGLALAGTHPRTSTQAPVSVQRGQRAKI
ncbi:putative epoxide hydrolase [Zalerion maritima]|uniref:Epoxide hydrolase n=1 Tax=Zalerion maritima TaxID=339359 RepID=A0AAD5RR60_9PEZI|nr:putative epoxide hydrolase [Zalerion maritima]